MAYALKSSGIATVLVVCVVVDEDGTTIVDLKGNTITLDSGVAASVATGSWKSVARKYFVTTADGPFGYFGVRWSSTEPTVDESDADGMSAWFACHGADNSSFVVTPFIEVASAEGLRNGLTRVSSSDAHGRYFPGGGTQAATATNLPTDGTTKFSFGANYESASDSEVFYGLESGSLASDGTAGSDGGFGGSARSVFSIGGSSGQGNQPFKPYCVCVFSRKLTTAEMQSLHDDWFGTLIDAPAGATEASLVMAQMSPPGWPRVG